MLLCVAVVSLAVRCGDTCGSFTNVLDCSRECERCTWGRNVIGLFECRADFLSKAPSGVVHCLSKCPAEPIADLRVVCLHGNADRCATITHGRGVPDASLLDQIELNVLSFRGCKVWHGTGPPRVQMRTCRRAVRGPILLAQSAQRAFPLKLAEYAWDGHENKQRRTLDRAKDVNNVVTVTMNTGADKLLTNFLNSVPHAVVFTPQTAIIPDNVRYHIPTGLVPSDSGSFGQNGFLSATAVKPALVLNVLLMGFNVTWADRDAVFNKTPVFPDDGCDIYASQDGGPMCADGGNRDSSCTGFLHFRHNHRVLKFVEAWAARAKARPNVIDQCHFQCLVTEGSGGAKVCALSLTEYANGFMWVPSVCHSSRSAAKTAAFRTYGKPSGCMTVSMLKAATVIHANYIVGNSNKIAALKAAGYWNSSSA